MIIIEGMCRHARQKKTLPGQGSVREAFDGGYCGELPPEFNEKGNFNLAIACCNVSAMTRKTVVRENETIRTLQNGLGKTEGDRR
jgi:hypothetical protein